MHAFLMRQLMYTSLVGVDEIEARLDVKKNPIRVPFIYKFFTPQILNPRSVMTLMSLRMCITITEFPCVDIITSDFRRYLKKIKLIKRLTKPTVHFSFKTQNAD